MQFSDRRLQTNIEIPRGPEVTRLVTFRGLWIMGSILWEPIWNKRARSETPPPVTASKRWRGARGLEMCFITCPI